MTNMLSAIPAKIYHWWQFTEFCFSERGDQIREARRLTKLGMHAVDFFPQSTREDLTVSHLEPFVAHILGMYYSTLGHHDSIQTLALSGHSLNSFMLLRSHLEAVLTFFYVTEPQTDLNEVYKRVDKYRDWVIIKMKQNTERSLRLDLARVVLTDDLVATIRRNYDTVRASYSDSLSDFKTLEGSPSFLTSVQRESLARTFNIEDLYNHIYAESSASIHFADISDRMEVTTPLTYRYTIRNKRGAFWPVMLSNLLEYKSIKQFSVFFGLESELTKRLDTIFISRQRMSGNGS